MGSLLLPWPLTAVRDLLAAPAWALHLGLLVTVLMALGARRDRLALGGLLLALAGPVLALPPTLDGYLAAERYAYVSVLGLALWLAGVLGEERAGRCLSPEGGPWRTALMGVLVAWLGLHFATGMRWWTDEALFSAASRALPNSSYAWHFLGTARLREADL